MFQVVTPSTARRLLQIALIFLFTINSSDLMAQSGVVNVQHVVDFDGNGRTDYAVGRLVGGPQIVWLYSLNPSGASFAQPWGLELDEYVPEDYDGDGKTDIAVWRPGAPGVAAFYILNSQTGTVRIEPLGQTDDDPSIVGDYNNDGRADVAVYRQGTPSTWFY